MSKDDLGKVPAPEKVPTKQASKSSDLVKVKNVTKQALFLAGGKLAPDAEGNATLAEVSNYSKQLKRV